MELTGIRLMPTAAEIDKGVAEHQQQHMRVPAATAWEKNG